MPKRLTTKEFIERAKKIHGSRYDYSLVEYGNTDTEVTIICKGQYMLFKKERWLAYG